MSKNTNLTHPQSPLNLSRSCFLIVLCIILTSFAVGAAQASTTDEGNGLTKIQPGETAVASVTMDSVSCCEIRGNVNHDLHGIDIADVVYLAMYMFTQGSPPPCPDEADVNYNGETGIDIADLVYLLNYMFLGGPPPVPCP